ncbi:MAG: putative quinol monooxygenase [Solirubrobacterales bacterium]
MHIIHVYFDIKPEKIERFKDISLENINNSVKEPGVIAFELLQQIGETDKFIFNEIYKTPEDHIKHRKTEHYKKWKLEIDSLTKIPYSALKYTKIK